MPAWYIQSARYGSGHRVMQPDLLQNLNKKIIKFRIYLNSFPLLSEIYYKERKAIQIRDLIQYYDYNMFDTVIIYS